MLKIEGIKKIKKPIIEYNERKYIFSIRFLVIFAIGAPLSAYLIYLFFDLEINYYLHEIVVKQTVYFLNLFFDMNASAVYNPVGKYHWDFVIPGKSNISFETFCTGIQAICVFAGVIIFTPHSQDSDTKRDVIWRKTKALIISSIIFYVVNIIRMLIQIELYNIGYAWEDIHFSISAASSFIAAIIVLLMHKWIPEFIISIIYVGTLVSEPVKQNRKKKVKELVKETGKVDLNLIRKVLRMEKKTYLKDIVKWSEEYGYTVEGNFLLIPDNEISNFIELLMQNKPFAKEKT
ncbi:MAG: archaeosortase H [Candidatus Hodarchaeota archaeon]